MPISFAISFVGLAINLLALTRQGFLFHHSRKKKRKAKEKMASFQKAFQENMNLTSEEEKAGREIMKQFEQELALLKELNFREKSNSFWSIMNVISSCCLFCRWPVRH